MTAQSRILLLYAGAATAMMFAVDFVMRGVDGRWGGTLFITVVWWALPVWLVSIAYGYHSELEPQRSIHRVYVLALVYSIVGISILPFLRWIPASLIADFGAVVWYATISPTLAALLASIVSQLRDQAHQRANKPSAPHVVLRLVSAVLLAATVRWGVLFCALLLGGQYGYEWGHRWWYIILVVSLWILGMPLAAAILGVLSPLSVSHTTWIAAGLSLLSELGVLVDVGGSSFTSAFVLLSAPAAGFGIGRCLKGRRKAFIGR